MKSTAKWLTAGVALSTVGILAGCGSANITTGGDTPTNTSNPAAVNAITNTTTNSTTNSVTNTTISASTTPAARTETLGNQARTWKTYTNQRFGFSVAYPSTWQMGPRPNDGDGRWFTTPSGIKSFNNGYGSNVAKSAVMLLVGGNSNVVNGSSNGYNFKQMVSDLKKSLQNDRKQQEFVTETYAVVPNKWVVDTLVTKVGHGGIKYTKTYVTLSTDQGISMIFPESKSNVYLPIWNYVTKTFQTGNKSG